MTPSQGEGRQNCFLWFHKWGEWKDWEGYTIEFPSYRFLTTQERECVRCHELQSKRVDSSKLAELRTIQNVIAYLEGKPIPHL